MSENYSDEMNALLEASSKFAVAMDDALLALEKVRPDIARLVSPPHDVEGAAGSCPITGRSTESLREMGENIIALREAGESLPWAEQGIRVTLEMDGVKRGFSINYAPIAGINSGYVANMVRDTIDAHVANAMSSGSGASPRGGK